MKSKHLKQVDILLFFVCFFIYIGCTYAMFYCQAFEVYESDMPAYVDEVLGTNTVYSFPYPLLFDFSKLIYRFLKDAALSTAMGATLLNGLSPFAFKYFMEKELARRMPEGVLPYASLLTTGVTYALLFVGILMFPMLNPSYAIYKFGGYGQLHGLAMTQNPWQNATFFAARPFAIAAFFLFARLLPVYDFPSWRRETWRDAAFFSFSLVLTTLAKPSFTLVLGSGTGVVMLFQLIRNRGKTLLANVRFACFFLPTVIILLYQYSKVFVSSGEEEQGIGFGIAEVWQRYCENIPLALLWGLLFPLLVLIFHWHDVKRDPLNQSAWLFLITALCEALLLYEKGFRKYDGNFDWGFCYAIAFVFAAAAVLMIAKTLRFRNLDKRNRACLVIEWSVFLWHTASGISAFLPYFMQGN